MCWPYRSGKARRLGLSPVWTERSSTSPWFRRAEQARVYLAQQASRSLAPRRTARGSPSDASRWLGGHEVMTLSSRRFHRRVGP